MEHIKALESNSSPEIEKAARIIAKNKTKGYCSHLADALTREIKKPRAWKTQCQLIQAIALADCQEGLPLLKELLNNKYESTILYRSLGFSVFILENSHTTNLGFLFESLARGNSMQISGACSAILYKKLIPTNEEIKKILVGVSKYTEDEGKVLTPRCYIASVAHLWPRDVTKDFLSECRESNWIGLVEIADLALQGKKPKIKLI